MRIQVMNKNEVERFHGMVRSEKYAVISISTPGKEPATIRSECHAVLYMTFHDMDNPDYNVPLFNEVQAKEIWSFVDNLDVGLLIVHCEAGISRSPAVAAAICRARGEDDQVWFRRYLPNRHVYSTMLKAKFGDPT